MKNNTNTYDPNRKSKGSIIWLTKKLVIQYMTTPNDTAIGRSACKNNSFAKIKGIDEGPIAKPIINSTANTIEICWTQGVLVTAQISNPTFDTIIVFKPDSSNIFLPKFSINIIDIPVVPAFRRLNISGRKCGCGSSNPLPRKVYDEENSKWALITTTLCADIISTTMVNLSLRELSVNMFLKDDLGASNKALPDLISSISECTSGMLRNQANELIAFSISFLSRRRWIGDSGQKGKIIS